jgi:hypothetical protein
MERLNKLVVAPAGRHSLEFQISTQGELTFYCANAKE